MEDKMHTIIANLKIQGKYYLKIIISYFTIVALCGFYLFVYDPVKGFCYIYYVDASQGDDRNDGQARSNAGSPPTHGPWKTFANINTYANINNNPHFEAGDKILLKRGETWQVSNGTLQSVSVAGFNVALAIQCGGISNNDNINYLTFGDYGSLTLAKPTVNGDGIAVNHSDCAILVNNDFVHIKNINVIYSLNGFDHNATVGKGISIETSTNSNVPDTQCNILIDACDISNCPENGISIGPGRKYIVIDGSSNIPTKSAMAPIINFVLNMDDSPEQTNLASSASTSAGLTSVSFPPPLPSFHRHIPRPHHIYRPSPPPPPCRMQLLLSGGIIMFPPFSLLANLSHFPHLPPPSVLLWSPLSLPHLLPHFSPRQMKLFSRDRKTLVPFFPLLPNFPHSLHLPTMVPAVVIILTFSVMDSAAFPSTTTLHII
jgi:hypothetical protein